MSITRRISDEDIKKYLNWPDTISAVRTAMVSLTEKRAFQTPRSSITTSNADNMLLTMPGYLNDSNVGALACKLVTLFPNNAKKNLPTISANILLFNEDTGALEAIMDGGELTAWRTAAASIVATQYIRGFNVNNEILAVVGAGEQAKIHTEAFQQVFNFKQVQIWNRNYEKAEKLCTGLNKNNLRCTPFEILEDCVKNADVIITATFATIPFIKYEWLKRGVHINAIGAGGKRMELDETTYKSSTVYVDHLAGIDNELKHLTEKGITFIGEVGSLITGDLPPALSNENTIFQSLGVAVEDCAVASMVYKRYIQTHE